MDRKDNLMTILKFMSASQVQCFMDGLIGDERLYFESIADKLAGLIKSAPAIYETDGQEEAVKPVLHYFYGSVDIYVTEIDTSGFDEHFGYTSLGHGYLEAGYINLDYIFSQLPLINLDFNFTPKTISEYRILHTKGV